MVRDRVARHCAKNQRALEAKIDAARLLGEALAKGDKHKRCRDAQRPADERENDDDGGALTHVRSAAPRTWNILKRPYKVSDISSTTKVSPCSSRTVASGRSMRRSTSPPEATMPPNRIATGMIASGLWRAGGDNRNSGSS